MAKTQGTHSLNPRYYAHIHRGVLYNAEYTANVVVYFHVHYELFAYTMYDSHDVYL
jgi:hypothetical protein